MRKVLNILESCSMAYKEIPASKIYEVTGRPSPDSIERIYSSLTVEDYKSAYDVMLEEKTTHSLALDDIIRELHVCINETNLDDARKMLLIGRLSEIEYRLAHGCNEKT